MQVKVIWSRRLMRPIACFFGGACSSLFAAKAWKAAIGGRYGVVQMGVRRARVRRAVRARNCIAGGRKRSSHFLLLSFVRVRRLDRRSSLVQVGALRMAAGGGQYAHAYSDSRVSGRVKLEPFDSPASSGDTLSLLLAKALLALSLCVTKDWLIHQNYSALSILPLAFLLAGFASALLDRLSHGGRGTNETSTATLYGAILLLESLFFLLALSKLSVLRLLALTSFATLWTRGALPVAFLSSLTPNTDRTSRRSTVGKNNAIFTTVAMVFAAYLVDVLLSRPFPSIIS